MTHSVAMPHRAASTVLPARPQVQPTGRSPRSRFALKRPRDWMRVDLDCFYVGVERVRDPRLIGRPVIVGGLPGERGVVACASYEARQYGVHAGMPIFQAVPRLPRRETVFLRGDHRAYLRASQAVMEVLESFSPAVHPLSLDEAWIDLRGLERHHPSWIRAATTLHDRIREATGLSASIGVGGSRVVAHVATRFAKPEGVMEVRRGDEARFLAHLPLRWLPGVGPRMAEALTRFHLETIGDLAAVPAEVLEETFGRNGRMLHERATGQDDDRIPEFRGFGMRSPENGRAGGRLARLTSLQSMARPKSISRESSFHRDSDDPHFIAAMCSYLAQRATAELREQRMRARSVEVRICYSDFQVARMRRRLSQPTDHDDPILAQVTALWPRCWSRRVRLRRVGVALHGLEVVNERQLDLFEDQMPVEQAAGIRTNDRVCEHAQGPLATVRTTRSRKALDSALDRIRDRHGFGAVARGQAIHLIEHLPAQRPSPSKPSSTAHAAEGEASRRNDGFLLRTPACSR